jgi:hypothetical protein
MSPSTASARPALSIPTGGQLLGFVSPPMQSTECASVTNLQVQIAPLIASLSCQLPILKLLKPLIDVIHGLPNPPVQALQEFSKAANDLAPCLFVPTPAGILPFLHDLLCLEIRSLHCFLRNLQAAISSAESDPSAVATAEVQNVIDSYAPIVGILNLASGMFQLAGLTIPTAPALAGGTDRRSLLADQSSVTAFTAALQTVADALGGCL